VEPEDDGLANCPIAKCDKGGVGCGVGARCTRGYCVCELGLKGNRNGTGVWRGKEGLQSVTVYSDVGVDCDMKCDDLSCKEVKQLSDGVCWKSGSVDQVDGQFNATLENGDGLVTAENIGTGGTAS
jgi:hypothetical protein